MTRFHGMKIKKLSICLAGHLNLNPNLQKAVRLAGDDNSFFISCLPFSSSIGPAGDSMPRARLLGWKRKIGSGDHVSWVTMGSQPSARVHTEHSADGRGLDLVFRSIETGDGGLYSCEANLDDKPVKSQFELKVIEPISFNPKNAVQSVEEGVHSFTLECGVSGNPLPKVSWNVRGAIIRGGQSSKYEVSDQGLIIHNVSKEDQGNYKCKATQFGEGITDFKDIVIQLKVEHGPELPPEQRGEFYGFISGVSNLTCEASAEPPADFKWLDRDNIEVAEGKVVNERHKSTLMLPVSHGESFGDYTCIASNKMGTLRKVVTLSEGAKPGIPYINIIKIGHETADVKIEENKAEMFLEIVGFRVEITEKKRQNWNNATIFYFKKEAGNTYRIEGLLPKTLYLLRAKAKNLAGLSDSSNVIYLQTNSPHQVGELLQSGGVNGINGGPKYVTGFSLLSLAFTLIAACRS